MRTIHHYIDGQIVPSGSGRAAPVFDPATGLVQANVDLASEQDVDAAVSAALAAFPGWRDTSLARRTEVMFNFREIFSSRRDAIAAIVSSEQGKVVADALGEVLRALENIEFACGVAQHLKGEVSHQASSGVDVTSMRQPLGVVANITPFNFPVMVPAWMFSTALACGNTVVAKPSERDPSGVMLIADWLTEAGLPTGVFNVLNGDKIAVDGLLAHPDVAAVSFVGSTPIARYVYETGIKAGKRVQALGGAKNHMVVLPDADIEMAADAAVSAGYGAAGERCMAISAVVAVGDAADQLVKAVADRIPGIVVGPGTLPGVEMGPLITAEHRDRVAGYIGGAVEAGATIVVDGRAAELPAEGFFLGPTLIDNVSTDMECYRDEVFGPVLAVLRVDTFEEAVAMINANPFGNGTAIFTRDGGAARRFEMEVEVGMVGINVPIPVPIASHSFGGWKSSLFGDTHMYGPEGIRFFTRAKVITSRWPDPATSTIDLGFPRNA